MLIFGVHGALIRKTPRQRAPPSARSRREEPAVSQGAFFDPETRARVCRNCPPSASKGHGKTQVKEGFYVWRRVQTSWA